jgi:prepilin-type N-terminal cleavage/methylation domain-containing protein
VQSTAGFSAIELVVTLAIIGVIVVMFASVARDNRKLGQDFKIEMLAHPSVSAVVSRVRRDVIDALDYGDPFGEYEQTEKVLILKTVGPNGYGAIVYDFREPNSAQRIEFEGETIVAEWRARQTLRFEIDSWRRSGTSSPYYVRLLGYDTNDNLIVDQLFVPRAL